MSSDSILSMGNTSSLNPVAQTFTILLSDGTPFNATIAQLDETLFFNSRFCASFGAQLGGTVLMIAMVGLITRPEKRRSPAFILNLLCLSLNALRCLLQILYFTGPWSEVYANLTGDYSRVPTSAFASSVSAEIISMLLLVAIEFSLVMQANVVCATMSETYRLLIAFTSAVVALTTIAFRFALTVVNVKTTISAASMDSWYWLEKGSYNLATISICLLCAIFVVKLGFAVQQRRRLGLKQFGPMQIVFIMGCQTMIIPALFSILTYWFDSVFPSMSSLTLTLVAMLVPLSSMWASTSQSGNVDESAPDRKLSQTRYSESTMNSDWRRGSDTLSQAHAVTARSGVTLATTTVSSASENEKWGSENQGKSVGAD